MFPGVSIDLRLLEVKEEFLTGSVMELNDSAYDTIEKVTPTVDPEVAFDNVDVAILVGGKPRGPGMERKDLLVANIGIFKAQGEVLNKVANPDCKVLVVANPANTNCLAL